jgi:hypothetical protein
MRKPPNQSYSDTIGGQGSNEARTDASPEALFEAVAKHHGGASAASGQRGFGSDALKVNGKIFAALSKRRLLIKLPSARADALVTANLAARFSTGAGRPKKEWVTVAPSSVAEWVRLSDEARQYVGSKANIQNAKSADVLRG